MIYNIRKWLSDLFYGLAVGFDPRIWEKYKPTEMDDEFAEWPEEWIAHRHDNKFINLGHQKTSMDECWIPTPSDIESIDNGRCPNCGMTLLGGTCYICMEVDE